jgi:hypothetical protein
MISIMIRFDFVFSYWIFTWYVLYICHIVQYNPKIGLMIGLFVNMISLVLMFFYHNDVFNIIWFIFINIFIKILPLYSLRYIPIRRNDLYVLCILFIVYLCWIWYNQVTFDFLRKIKENKPFSPLLEWIIHNKNIYI